MYRIKKTSCKRNLNFTLLHSWRCSWPERLFAVVAGKRNSLQMVCFDVVFYILCCSLFSTYLFTNLDHIWTLFHHWFYLVIKFFQVVGVTCCWYCHSCFIFIALIGLLLAILMFSCNCKSVQMYWRCFFSFDSFFIFISHQPFKFKLLSNRKKRVKIFLKDICLTAVKKVNDSIEVFRLHPSHENQCTMG